MSGALDADGTLAANEEKVAAVVVGVQSILNDGLLLVSLVPQSNNFVLSCEGDPLHILCLV